MIYALLFFSQTFGESAVASTPPSGSSSAAPPPQLPLPSLFTSLSWKRRLCYVIVFLSSLVVLPVPRFLAGALFGAVLTTAFWSLCLIIHGGLKTVTDEEKKDKTPVEIYEDGR